MKPIHSRATTIDFIPDSQTLVPELTEIVAPSLDSFDLVVAELQRRADAKTLILEESLQRAESAQRRFWGINE
ncbi:MAG TPA: hypothetical protein VL361_02555 [Candidatus Limnocylindrales bacterium]|nr:hypothetical protein [Candidatus Limnocylindrales bacterium]